MPAQTFTGATTGAASTTGALTHTRHGLAAAITASVALTGALGLTGHGFSGASAARATPASSLKRKRVFSGTSTAIAMPAGASLKGKPLAGSSSAAASTAGALSLVRVINVLVDLGPEAVRVTEAQMVDTGLKPVPFRSNESRAISHRLYVNGSLQDLTGWTIELWVNTGTPSAAVLRSITTATAAAMVGQIKNQTTNPGEYFFTVLAADVVTLLGSNTALTVPCRIRFVTPDTAPPRTFSNVVFPLLLTVS